MLIYCPLLAWFATKYSTYLMFYLMSSESELFELELLLRRACLPIVALSSSSSYEYDLASTPIIDTKLRLSAFLALLCPLLLPIIYCLLLFFK